MCAKWAVFSEPVTYCCRYVWRVLKYVGGITYAHALKPSSQYDVSQRVRKNRTNFYSSVWVKTGARRHASLGNGSEPASSELRVATRHIVN